MGFALTGAALVELLFAERIEVVEKDVHLLEATPTGHDACDLLLGLVSAQPRPRKASAWVKKAKRTLVAPTAAELARREIVQRDERTLLGLVPWNRYPILDPRPAEALRARLRLVVAGGAPSDDRTAILALLVDATQLAGSAMPGVTWFARQARMKELLAGTWQHEAVKTAVVAVRKAIQEQQASGAAASM